MRTKLIMCLVAALTACLLDPWSIASGATLTVSSDFENGSGVVESIDQDAAVIRIKPSSHPGRGWDCWWYVKVTGIKPGATLTINLGSEKGVWAMPQRAAFSVDGATWKQTEPGKRDGARIIYRQRIDADIAWFAWGPPFTPRDAQVLLDRIARESKWAEAFELCKTVEGRPVPALHVREPGTKDDERFGVWINARQHAWESGSSWVCRGLIEWLVSDDERATTLRRKADITIVPIMDIDNVAIGAGGKEQTPHDHNRDWHDEPHFTSVRAAMARIKGMDDAGRFDLFIDLHNPGAGDLQPFYFVPPDDVLGAMSKRNLAWFFEDGRSEIIGPMRLASQTRPSGREYDKLWQWISKNWVTTHTRDHVVAVTLETSWNTPNSNVEGYMAVGRQQGLAIERYLRRPVREAGK